MHPYLLVVVYRNESERIALWRPVVPGSAIFDVEGFHHRGDLLDRPIDVRVVRGEEGRDDHPVLYLGGIGQDAAVLVQDQLSGFSFKNCCISWRMGSGNPSDRYRCVRTFRPG